MARLKLVKRRIIADLISTRYVNIVSPIGIANACSVAATPNLTGRRGQFHADPVKRFVYARHGRELMG